MYLIRDHSVLYFPFPDPIFEIFDDFVDGVKRCVDLFRSFFFAFLDFRCIGSKLID